MTDIVYINYLSKCRNNSPEEVKYNLGRIATKRVLKEDIIINDNLSIMSNKLYTRGYKWQIIDKTYQEFKIPKRSGGMRTIKAPNESLKDAQQQFLTMVQKDMRWLPHNCAHGFVKHRNCKTALEVHQKHKSRWFLKIDIHDFFGSTTVEMVREALDTVYPFCAFSNYVKDSIALLTTSDRVVPQGAPTSPFICNAVMVKYDYKIQKYCHENNLIYTRYADDILISSRCKWDYTQTLEKIKTILSPYTLSEHKIRFGSFNGRNWNLGIMFNNKYELTVGHEKKHILKCAVHNYLTKPEIRETENWYALMGKLSYASYIEPNYTWFKEAMNQLQIYNPSKHTQEPATGPCSTDAPDELPW